MSGYQKHYRHTNIYTSHMETEDPLVTEWEWSNYTSGLEQLTLKIYNLTESLEDKTH